MYSHQQPIKLIETGGKPMMQFLNCSIDFPQNNGLYFVSSGCGSGKTTIIAEIAQKYRSDGVLIVVPTIDAAEDLRSQLQPIGTYILHSGELSSDRLLNYRNAPMRQQIHKCGDFILIDDSYNASPEAAKASLDVLKSVDYLIDMGPGGGAAGGRIVATGTPAQVAADPASVTGPFLKELL